MQLDVRSDTRRIVMELRAEQENVTKAQARALNRTVEQLATEAGRKVRAEYNVTLRGIRQATKLFKASTSNKFPRVEARFAGRAINLAEFGARPVNAWNVRGRRHGKTGGGVSVQVKVNGPRKLIQHAFIATLKNGQNAGKKGVFRRVGGPRSKIRFMPSLSIPQMTAKRAISEALIDFADDKYDGNLRQALLSVMKGY